MFVGFGGIRYLLEGVARHARLREDRKPSAGITVAPRRSLYPLAFQTILDVLEVHSSGN
jgi:hypothetical protein